MDFLSAGIAHYSGGVSYLESTPPAYRHNYRLQVGYTKDCTLSPTLLEASDICLRCAKDGCTGEPEHRLQRSPHDPRQVAVRRCCDHLHGPRDLCADIGVVLRGGRWWGLRDVPEQDDRHGLFPGARAREPQPQGELALLLAQRVRFERVERKRGELVRGEREQQRGDAGLYDHDGVPAGVRLERDPVPVAEAVAVVPGAAGVAVERGCGGGGRAGADAGAAGDVRQSVCVVLPARERDVQWDASGGGGTLQSRFSHGAAKQDREKEEETALEPSADHLSLLCWVLSVRLDRCLRDLFHQEAACSPAFPAAVGSKSGHHRPSRAREKEAPSEQISGPRQNP